MFKFFSKKESKNTHEHKFCIKVARYFKVKLSEDRKSLDVISVYERNKCLCGVYHDFDVSIEIFLPSMSNREQKEQWLIKKLKQMGVKEEFEMGRYE